MQVDCANLNSVVPFSNNILQNGLIDGYYIYIIYIIFIFSNTRKRGKNAYLKLQISDERSKIVPEKRKMFL